MYMCVCVCVCVCGGGGGGGGGGGVCDTLSENPAKVIFLWFAIFYQTKSSFIW